MTAVGNALGTGLTIVSARSLRPQWASTPPHAVAYAFVYLLQRGSPKRIEST